MSYTKNVFSSGTRAFRALILAEQGRALMLEGKAAEAEPVLIESLQYAQTEVGYRALHLTLCKLGRFTDALYNAYVWQSFSDTIETKLCLAEIYRKLRRYRTAIDVLALIPRPDRWRKVWLCLAYCHMHSSDWDAALLCFEAAEQDASFLGVGRRGNKQLRTYAGFLFLYDKYLQSFPEAYQDEEFVHVLFAHARRAAAWLRELHESDVGDLQQHDFASAWQIIVKRRELWD